MTRITTPDGVCDDVCCIVCCASCGRVLHPTWARMCDCDEDIECLGCIYRDFADRAVVDRLLGVNAPVSIEEERT